MGSSVEPILITKLHRPEPRPRRVERERLLDLLDRGLTEQRRLTLISAPAGYGKTTLASAWLQRLLQDQHGAAAWTTTWAVAWLGLDENDNDPTRFFLHLVASLRGVSPGIGAGTLDLVASPHQAEISAIMTPLINELAALPCRLLLVLDDYHAISTARIHAALDFLCRHAPHNLHLVLLTRADPPLALATLRGRGLLTELRTRDLRFSGDEVRAFFAAALQQPIAADAVDALGARTEGWVAGLQLAALSLEGCDAEEVAAFVTAFRGSNRYIMDYLAEQVLQRLPTELRSFLCQAAVLERMCAPLCDALTGRQDSSALLAQLEGANLFLVRLDPQGVWFRFHHLFAELLRLELDDVQQANLHCRAAAWLADHNFLPEAVHHALAAGDFLRAAELIRQAAPALLRTCELRMLLQWIERLPPAVVQADAELTAQRSLALFFSGQVAQAAAAIQALDPAYAANAPPPVQGRLLALRAWLAELHGQPDAEQLARTALALAPAEDPFARMIALLPLGHAQRAAGHTQASVETFRIAVAAGQQMGHSFAAVAGLIDLAFSLLEQGSQRETLALCEEALQRYVDGRGQPLPVACLLNVPLAAIYYHANELDKAQECARRGIEVARQVLSENILGGDAQRFLALAQFASGQAAAALATLREAQQGAEQVHYRRSANVLAATQAHLHLRAGNLTAARQWAAAQPFQPDCAPSPGCELEYCVYAHWLRAEGRNTEALQALTTVAQQAAAGGRFGRLIGVRISQALVASSLSRQADACNYLAEAVSLAAPNDFRSQFLDVGEAVLPLLAQVRAAAPAFVDDLLQRAGRQAAPADLNSSAVQPLAEPLSARELEVLALLAKGLSYRQMAQQLIVAQGTIQAHCSSIYGKLGVNNRTQAVLRAGELNLLA
jgi:LuxR family maltose regulon positive regulatory protein